MFLLATAAYHSVSQIFSQSSEEPPRPTITPENEPEKKSRIAGNFSIAQRLSSFASVKEFGKTPQGVAGNTVESTNERLLDHEGADKETRDTGKKITDAHSPSTSCDINANDSTGNTLLHLAANARGTGEMVKLLLKQPHLRINAVNQNSETALHCAIRAGNTEIVQLLLERGADLQIRDSQGRSVLCYALENYREDIIRLLLGKGLQVHASDLSFCKAHLHRASLLRTAAAMNNLEMVKVLAKHADVDVNAVDPSGNAALHLAAREGHQKIVRFLIKKGAHVDAKNSSGKNPLHMAAAKGYIAIVRQIHRKGGDVNAIDQSGNTPLHLASQEGHQKVARFLIKNGAHVYMSNSSGRTPLHTAAEKGFLPIVRRFLKQKNVEKAVYVNAGDQSSDTALHLALHGGHQKVAQLLISNGARVHIRNSSGRTPLHAAAEKGLTILVGRILKQKNVNTNAVDQSEDTALHLAIRKGNADIAHLLIKKGANTNAANKYQETPLHLAVDSQNISLVQSLLKKGAHINAADHNHSTALHKSISTHSIELITVLLDQENIAVDAQDQHKNTPLHYAILDDKAPADVLLPIIKHLLNKGASMHIKNSDGYTALDYAQLGRRGVTIAPAMKEWNQSFGAS